MKILELGRKNNYIPVLFLVVCSAIKAPNLTEDILMGVVIHFPVKSHYAGKALKEGGGNVVEIGERYKDKESGKIYVVQWVGENAVILQKEGCPGQRLTSPESLRQTSVRLDDREFEAGL